MSRGKLTNCLGCGRDTRASSGYCHRCISIGTPYYAVNQMPSETKDRPTFRFDGDSPNQLTVDAEDDYSEDSMGPTEAKYDDLSWRRGDRGVQ